MLTNRERKLIKTAYLEGFDEGWTGAIDEEALSQPLREVGCSDLEVYELCENWLTGPVDGASMFNVEMVISTDAGEN